MFEIKMITPLKLVVLQTSTPFVCPQTVRQQKPCGSGEDPRGLRACYINDSYCDSKTIKQDVYFEFQVYFNHCST